MRDNLRPATDVRQSTERTPGHIYQIEGTWLPDNPRCIVKIGLNEAGLFPLTQLFCKFPGRDNGGR